MDTNSEEWRHHCEALTLLQWSEPERMKHLCNVESRRGGEERRKLENTLYRMRIERQVERLKAMNPQDQIVHLTRLERATNSRTRGDVERALERCKQAANDNETVNDHEHQTG